MYTTVLDSSVSNEELALRIQRGDRQATELLVVQNESYLKKLAQSHTAWCELDDLKQEGALALLLAAQSFDPAYGTRLLTYATTVIEAAMSDYAARFSLSLSISSSRYHQLRRVVHICTEAEDESEPAILNAVCAELDVSPQVAADLLQESRMLFWTQPLEEAANSANYAEDPAVIYDCRMRWRLLRQLMDEVLKPREMNLVCCYLGIGQPDDKCMTFQELAIRFNYNGPSGAEKVYKTALRKLKENLYSGAYGQWLSIQRAIRDAKAEAAASHSQ